MRLRSLLNKFSKYDIYAIIVSALVIFMAIYIAYKLGLGYNTIIQFLPVLLASALVSFFTSKRFFESLIWSETKYIVEISDDLNMHRLIAVSGNIFSQLKILRPIVISFGNLIYADYFDEDSLTLIPTWIHHKIDFLKTKKALEILKKEYESIEEEYGKLKAIADTLALITARKRVEELEALKKKLIEEV